ncbi:MAG: hypothetical protein E6K24_16580 [Gammaproteobacteria bacterium]|nr:MAG: hypothetical protein E6K24_16580 [Gammaproteobacteria bacterium]
MVTTGDRIRLAGLLAAGLLLSTFAGSAASAGDAAAAVAATSQRATHAAPRSRRGEAYYAATYGVDQLQVRSVSSGASLEFRYRVLDPGKASVLNDKRATPYLIDQKSGTRLTVPTMEKIGTLRQVADPEPGREYWMLFANAGKVVKAGQRVDIVIGAFHASSLLVE